jgi:imidazolonepropionase-like amidohydrolase
MPKIAITNALIFNGYGIKTDRMVTIDNGIVSTDATDARVLDCSGMTLLPGLIDAHVHMLPNNDESTHLLKHMAECGVTTALDMGHLPAAVRNAFCGQAGLADLRFATSSGSTHSRMGQLPKTHLGDSTGQAAQFVQERINEGADYVGVVADISGPARDPERLGH